MRRREFIKLVGGAAAWPPAAQAQPATRRRLVAMLVSVGGDDPDQTALVAAFHEELTRIGWIDGRNMRFEQRDILGDFERLSKQAAEVVAMTPDVIVTNSNLGTSTVLKLTRTIPIVFATAGDPVGTGLVANMARPGGNVTGFVGYEVAIAGKWLELLQEVAPSVTRVAMIFTPGGAGSVGLMNVASKLAPSFGVQPTSIPAGDGPSLERAIDAFAADGGNGMLVLPGPSTVAHRVRIIAAAARNRLPATYPRRYDVPSGGLLAYGGNSLDSYRRAAGYVDRILRGEKPGDLPVQAPTNYKLVVNLKTAKALGLKIPEAFLLRADEVIE
jgi:putative ABC transport system substrate-binding protein